MGDCPKMERDGLGGREMMSRNAPDSFSSPQEGEPLLETKETKSLKQQNAILRKIARDQLGEGIWGLRKDIQRFTHEEIVFLFARVFSLYGIDYVKEIRTNYPDCICVKEAQEIGIEFEALLSGFQSHLANSDDLTKCQYIVCWKDDVEIHSPLRHEIERHKINVLELERLYNDFRVKRRSQSVEWTENEMARLKPNQLKVLNVFISLDRDVLKTGDIGDSLNIHGRALGGALKGFTEMAKRKEWLVRKHPMGWQFNKKYRQKVVTTIKEFGKDIGIIPS